MAKKTLSQPMVAMLKNAERGLQLTRGLCGRSEFGGATGTREALFARGLITRVGTITAKGSDALCAELAKEGA